MHQKKFWGFVVGIFRYKPQGIRPEKHVCVCAAKYRVQITLKVTQYSDQSIMGYLITGMKHFLE